MSPSSFALLDHRRLGVLFAALMLAAGCQNDSSHTLPTEDGGVTFPPANKKSGMTWYKDVLPITQVHCQGCHTTSGIAPFPLLTYDDAKKFAMPMASAVQSRVMPPWMPKADCQSFRDARTLTQDQIDTIYSWADDGAPAGSPTDAPAAPAPPTGLAWVDKTLDTGTAYTPNNALTDDYHCFVLDPALAADQTLIGYDFAAGVSSEVHHVLVYAGSLSEAQAKDAATPEAGYTCFGGPGLASTQLVAAWVPGTSATTFPTGTGVPIKKGSGLVMQIHYNLLNGVSPDKSTLKLQYARQAVGHPATIQPLNQNQFTIPKMTDGYSANKSMTINTAVKLWGLAPHMHMLGQRALVQATPPGGGADSCLIDIPAWDFHWQQLYFYDTQAGISLPAGTKITLTCTWDNNTTSPVKFGEATTDEMCLTYFYTTQ